MAKRRKRIFTAERKQRRRITERCDTAATETATPSASGPSFCEELIFEILVRVSSKTLIRCKCVCKTWRALISSKSFFNGFLARSTSLPPIITGFFYRENPKSMVVNFLRCGTVTETLDTSLRFAGSLIAVVSSHNGLLLCARMEKQRIKTPQTSNRTFHYVVCNLLTKECVPLPKHPFHHNMSDTVLFCCNDEMDFKVLCILDSHYNCLEVEVYSSVAGYWKTSNIYHVLHNFSPGTHYLTLFNGYLYMWGLSKTEVCVFDFMKENNTNVIQLPTLSYEACEWRNGILGVSSQSLYYAKGDEKFFSVWVLVGEDQWSLKFNIALESFLSDFPNALEPGKPLRPVALHPVHCHLVLVRLAYTNIVALYDINKGKFELLDDIDPCHSTVVPYHLPAWPMWIRNA